MNQYHYHMALKLKRRGRWVQVRANLDEKFGIKVNFSDHHNTYYSSYKYVTKEDSNAEHSDSHPDLQNAPRTEQAITGKKRKGRISSGSASSQKQRKRRRDRALTVYDVSQIIQQRKISKRIELVCLAVQPKREGNTALAEFIANKRENAVDDALAVAKEFDEAEKKLARMQKSRVDLLTEAKEEGKCVAGCEGKWLLAAEQLLESNSITHQSFCDAIYIVLEKAGGNIRTYIHGPANCGKTFILHFVTQLRARSHGWGLMKQKSFI
ncbi:Hypothetical predicted protein [Paramuricea clavata]|uniref:Uncharacterized protein n=1 Tax=Paramuricea clavata TaxID=317549 RepID=A0A7D9HEJ0_PARCT|nr:Hypothetical predicted protein [Paramuricea clavata]